MSTGHRQELPPPEAWVRSAVSQIGVELRTFAHTFASFATRPRRAAAEWAAGTRTYMNPLGFVATAAGAYWAVISVLGVLWPVPGDSGDTILDQLTAAIGPQVHYGLLGVGMHVGLRALRSQRSVAGSVGVAFFAGGSIGTAAAVFMMSLVRYFGHMRGSGMLEMAAGDLIPISLFMAAIASYTAVCAVMARAMMGVHGAAGWKAAVAAGFAIIATAFLFGSVLPAGAYGWHPYIDVAFRHGLQFSFGFRG